MGHEAFTPNVYLKMMQITILSKYTYIIGTLPRDVLQQHMETMKKYIQDRAASKRVREDKTKS